LKYSTKTSLLAPQTDYVGFNYFTLIPPTKRVIRYHNSAARGSVTRDMDASFTIISSSLLTEQWQTQDTLHDSAFTQPCP